MRRNRVPPEPDGNQRLHPVLYRIGDGVNRCLTIRQRVRFLSRAARQALLETARCTGLAVDLDHFRKSDQGIPLPVMGYHWSVSHKPKLVGGVIAPFPVGLDVEAIGVPARGLFDKVADPEEWAVMGGMDARTFYRLWTAKEAVLKTGGRGLSDLSKCRVAAAPERSHLILTYAGRRWTASHLFLEDHIAAITAVPAAVQWHVSAIPDACQAEAVESSLRAEG